MRTSATRQFTLTLGLAPGYSALVRPQDAAGVADVAAAWHRQMLVEGVRSGVYVAAVVHGAAAVYHNEAGCPFGGEPIAVLMGTRNPHYAADEEAWELAVLRIAGALKAEFRQVTCQVIFADVQMVYYEADD